MSPGQFELTKAAVLSDIFSQVTKPLTMGATNRIRVHRDGVIITYDLKKFGHLPLNVGDIVEVPIKCVYEGQGEVQDSISSISCEDPKLFLGKVGNLKSDLWQVAINWHDGIEGVEFRPVGKIGENGGVWVFVRSAVDFRVNPRIDPKRVPLHNGKAVVIISRIWGRGHGDKDASEFELSVLRTIANIDGAEDAK